MLNKFPNGIKKKRKQKNHTHKKKTEEYSEEYYL